MATMIVTHTAANLAQELSNLRLALDKGEGRGMSIGLVPTMGALHAGHLSLVIRSLADNDVTIVSIFVNPTQFNDPSDLATYPRTLDADVQLLSSLGAGDIVAFAPSVEEMYPTLDTRRFSYPPTDEVMEGGRRPGHFNGVCQIVSKLFYLVKPEGSGSNVGFNAYFGEKDFQQIAVIRAMTRDLFPDGGVRIHSCPIVREESGLALSSRNTRLTEAERAHAALIHSTLADSAGWGLSVAYTRDRVVSTLHAAGGFEVEYFEIVDGITLTSVSDWAEADYVVGCITVYTGADRVRLIDNITYKRA